MVPDEFPPVAASRLTPAMEQYRSFKAQHPDAILFFRIGDFYETFDSDAETVSRELEIVLTARSKDSSGHRVPLAGVPYHAAEGYIARLVAKGYRVAVCDQVEDARVAKGIVKRAVVRVVTPGTITDASMLPTPDARYLMAVARDPDRREYALAFLETSTGEFSVTVCGAGDALEEVFTQVARFQPREAVLGDGVPAGVQEGLRERGIPLGAPAGEPLRPSEAELFLKEHFRVAALDGFGLSGEPAAAVAAATALRYAAETLHASLTHVTAVSLRRPREAMVLDTVTLRNLEVLEPLRAGTPQASLMSILDRTVTPAGARRLRKDLSAPLLSAVEINARLDAVEFFVKRPLPRQEVRSLLSRFPDIERVGARIAYGNATPRDLDALSEALLRLPALKGLIAGAGLEGLPSVLAAAAGQIRDCPEQADLIGRAIADDPPATTRNGGMIRLGYSRDLDALRGGASTGKDSIAALQQREREATGIRSLKVGYNQVFGYYIEVTKPNLHLVPERYRRKQTTASGERFTLPELSEQEGRIARAEEQALALEGDLYEALLATLREIVPLLQETAAGIATIDLATTLADVAVSNRYVRPVLDDSGTLLIREGRHPVVEQGMKGRFVPNDTGMDSGKEQILVITGANMSGKSTYMRATALIVLMAQAGSYVPAAHARVGIVDRIFTRVGAFDDLSRGQSTFLVEMLELAHILHHATDRSLVILDEIGRGTSTLDGYSLARATLEFLHGKGPRGPRTLFATHFHQIVDVETTLPRVRNFHFTVRDTKDGVVFVRKIIPGATDRSYGIHVARLAGIPPKV
ncbi:MAG: DNA mismatch repair protein MutS, partial [Methanomicrobiales archaeon]|nr:DNA mismatch repair protein MutS [Methanomicrobiales archaeon]